jgi:hypothetical protein
MVWMIDIPCSLTGSLPSRHEPPTLLERAVAFSVLSQGIQRNVTLLGASLALGERLFNPQRFHPEERKAEIAVHSKLLAKAYIKGIRAVRESTEGVEVPLGVRMDVMNSEGAHLGWESELLNIVSRDTELVDELGTMDLSTVDIRVEKLAGFIGRALVRGAAQR